MLTDRFVSLSNFLAKKELKSAQMSKLESGYEIDVQTLARLRRDGAEHTVLDIRDPEEIELWSIDDSLLIPMQEVPEKVAALPRDHPIIVLCHSGGRGAKVTDFLRERGFDNSWNLSGGIRAWTGEVKPAA